MTLDSVNKISISDLTSGFFSQPVNNLPSDCLAFNYLRSAIDFLFGQFEWKNKKIVFPAFVCPIVVEVALRHNITPLLLDVNEADFNLDANQLDLVNLDTVDAVFFTNTFGVINDTAVLQKKIGQRPIKIIEDSANSCPGMRDKEISDYHLFSFYKYLPNLRGGALKTKDKIMKEAYQSLPVDKINLSDWIKFILHIEGVHQWLFNYLRKGKIKEPEPTTEMRWAISKISPTIEKLYHYQAQKLWQEISRRQKLAEIYLKHVDEKYYRVQKKSIKSCHFNFSIALHEALSPNRNNILRQLRSRGIFADRLCYNSPSVIEPYKKYLVGDCNVSKKLATGIINLPIRSNYDESAIAWLFKNLHEICAAY